MTCEEVFRTDRPQVPVLQGTVPCCLAGSVPWGAGSYIQVLEGQQTEGHPADAHEPCSVRLQPMAQTGAVEQPWGWLSSARCPRSEEQVGVLAPAPSFFSSFIYSLVGHGVLLPLPCKVRLFLERSMSLFPAQGSEMLM